MYKKAGCYELDSSSNLFFDPKLGFNTEILFILLYSIIILGFFLNYLFFDVKSGFFLHRWKTESTNILIYQNISY